MSKCWHLVCASTNTSVWIGQGNDKMSMYYEDNVAMADLEMFLQDNAGRELILLDDRDHNLGDLNEYKVTRERKKTADKWEAESAAHAGFKRSGDFWVMDMPNGFWRRLFGMKRKQYNIPVGSFPLLAVDGMYQMEL